MHESPQSDLSVAFAHLARLKLLVLCRTLLFFEELDGIVNHLAKFDFLNRELGSWGSVCTRRLRFDFRAR